MRKSLQIRDTPEASTSSGKKFGEKTVGERSGVCWGGPWHHHEPHWEGKETPSSKKGIT